MPKTKEEYTKQEYLDEIKLLWEEVVEKVYLKKIEYPELVAKRILEMGTDAFEETKFTPFGYILFIADPTNVTNRIHLGQKAREKRWNIWKKEKQNIF